MGQVGANTKTLQTSTRLSIPCVEACEHLKCVLMAMVAVSACIGGGDGGGGGPLILKDTCKPSKPTVGALKI